jgi:hypothetical protein
MKIVVLDGYTLNPGDLSWKDYWHNRAWSNRPKHCKDCRSFWHECNSV